MKKPQDISKYLVLKGTKVRKDILLHSCVAAVFLFTVLHCLHSIHRHDLFNQPDIEKILKANFSIRLNDSGNTDTDVLGSNETGEPIVPNYIHFILLENANNITFTHYLCILAAMKNQRPDIIFFHTDTGDLRGDYWDRLAMMSEFRRVAKISLVLVPEALTTQPLDEEIKNFYAVGILKILLLRKYGGIYLSTSTFTSRDLKQFRNSELTLAPGPGHGMNIGSQIIVAHKDARFLKVWHKFYRYLYENSGWYFFRQNPIDRILGEHPNLAKQFPEVGQLQFYDRDSSLFRTSLPFWRKFFAFILPDNLRFVESDESQSETSFLNFQVSEENVQLYHIPLSEMIEDVAVFARNGTDETICSGPSCSCKN